MKEKRVDCGSAADKACSAVGSTVRGLEANSFFPILIILFFSFLVYFNAPSGDFVFDDQYQIADNPWIRDIKNIPAIFSGSVSNFLPGLSTSNYYRPLMHIVYMFSYHLFGLRPWGFHLVNILFHCGASVLVFMVMRKLLEHKVTTSSVYLSPPFMVAMLFASHPIHTEAVTWIAGLPDVAFTFFYLLSFYLYMLFRDGAKRGYLLSILSFAVATLFKEPALTLPIMLIAYDCLLKKSKETISAGMRRYIPYAVVSVGYLLVRYYALRSFAPMESYATLSTYQYIINIFPLFQEYLTSLLWPFNLNLWHTFHPLSSLFEPRGMISIAVTVMFFIVSAAACRKNKALFFGLLLFAVPLLPVFYIRGIAGKPFAERYLYLPSVGYVLFLGVFLSWAKEKLPRAAKSIAIVFIVIVGLYTIGTITRNNDWKDSFNLWTDTVKKAPDSAEAHNNLGNAYASKSQLDMAMAEYGIALRLNPDFVEAHYNLGNAYASRGQLDLAIAEYEMVLRLKPDDVMAHNNLGNAYASRGQLDSAIAEYEMVLRLNPDDAMTHYNLALICLIKGNVDIARREAETSLRIRPDLNEARQLLNDIIAKRR